MFDMPDRRRFDGICVDSPQTKYPEDCFLVVRSNDGWLLEVAVPDVLAKFSKDSIADTMFFENSGIDRYAVMLAVRPEHYSFKPNTEKPCIVVKSFVSNEGDISYSGWERAIHTGICHTDIEIEQGRASGQSIAMWQESKEMITAVKNRVGSQNPLFHGPYIGTMNIIAGSSLGSYLYEEGKGAFLKLSTIGSVTLNRLVSSADILPENGPLGLPYAQFTSPLRRYTDLHNIRELLGIHQRDTNELVATDQKHVMHHTYEILDRSLNNYNRTHARQDFYDALSSGIIVGQIPQTFFNTIREVCRDPRARETVSSMLHQFQSEFPKRTSQIQTQIKGILVDAVFESQAISTTQKRSTYSRR